jgi:hypothetical protein
MQHPHSAWIELRFSQPPNLYYSLDGVDFVKKFRIYTRICKKITTQPNQLHSPQNSVAGLTFVAEFHGPYQIHDTGLELL